MSWSVSAQGKKDDVREQLASQFDSCAKNYEGQEEGKDIASARERVMAALAELDCTTYVPEGQEPRQVRVSAWGSRSHMNSDGRPSAVQFHVAVDRVDPTPGA